MAEFTVSEVIPVCRSIGAGRDGDTFKVKNGWKWEDKTGDTVRASGCNTSEKGEPGYEETKQKLKRLILNEKVEIKNVQTIDDWGRLEADVYYRGKNLADYFPEYLSADRQVRPDSENSLKGEQAHKELYGRPEGT